MRSAGRRCGMVATRGRLAAAVGVALVVAPMLAACGSEGGKTINVYYSPEENFQSVVDKCNENAGGRYNIVYNKLPRDADGQREQMVRRLAAEDSGMDVLGLDVTWMPEFAEAGWVLEWTGQNKAEAERGVLKAPLETATWNGKLYGATKNTNVQLLWYDDRLTPTPPKTFDEMISMAKDLKARNKPYQVVFTGAQYEGYVVHINTLTRSAGGRILSDDGKSVVIDEGAVRALELMKTLATSGITNPALANAKEQQVQLAFEDADSQAAFQINWPYVYSSMQENNPERAKHFKWARYPAVDPGQDSQATVGGYNLAVSAHSKYPAESFETALCLRSAESQKYSAVTDGVPPTIESVYSDTTPVDPSQPASDDNPSMDTKYPMKQAIIDTLKDAGIRPLTPAYQNASTVLSNLLSPPSGIDPAADAEQLREELADALESKGLVP